MHRGAEVGPCNPKPQEQAADFAITNIPLSSFDCANEAAIEFRFVRERLLRVSAGFAKGAECVGEWF
jgi:hypothetical protein